MAVGSTELAVGHVDGLHCAARLRRNHTQVLTVTHEMKMLHRRSVLDGLWLICHGCVVVAVRHARTRCLLRSAFCVFWSDPSLDAAIVRER